MKTTKAGQRLVFFALGMFTGTSLSYLAVELVFSGIV